MNHYGVVFGANHGSGRACLSVSAEGMVLAMAKARRVSGLDSSGIDGWEIVSIELLQKAGRGIPTTNVTLWRLAQTKKAIRSVEEMRAANGIGR